MSDEEKRPDDERRIAELLRVNGELAAEVRQLTLGRRVKPSAQMPAARGVAKLQAERDTLAGELEASRAEVDHLSRQGEEMGRHIENQTRRIEELGAEVAKLRGGVSGVLRRARARLLLHR